MSVLRRQAQGSPPQVRGKLRYEGIEQLLERITPAGAGKTNKKNCNYFFPQDHPRRCGENAISIARLNRISGSPPQVRGKHPHSTPLKLHNRITPAGAGKTADAVAASHTSMDHPRRCGENIFIC